MAGTHRTYSAWLRRWWMAAATAGAGYGIFPVVAALRLPAGAERERRWRLGALLFSAGVFFGHFPSDGSATPAL
jgi:hypothetical protein